MGIQIGKPPIDRLLQVLGIVLTVQFGVQICSCTVTSYSFSKILNTRMTGSLNQIQHVSVIECCSECNTNSWCNGLSYKPSTEECELSDTSCGDIGPSSVTDNEWVTFIKDVTACIRYLVSGPNGISNSRLTASSNYGDHRPWHARLNSAVWSFGGWAKAEFDDDIYIQADFTQTKVIAAFALQGRAITTSNDVTEFVTRFRVLTSLDCLNFSYMVDDSDDEKTFEGNSNTEQIVTRYLQRELVLARCVRINPVEWIAWPTLRFDVLGF